MVKNNVVIDEKTVIPAGSTVQRHRDRGEARGQGRPRAARHLAITSLGVEGTDYAATATTPAIEAGSTRARNLGAIAAGTGAGALVGGAVGGKKGAVIGGLLGGGRLRRRRRVLEGLPGRAQGGHGADLQHHASR